MIYYLIAAAAIVNVILAVLSLTKGRNRLNLSFSILSFLLAGWNISIVFMDGYNMPVFSRVNFLFVTYIPAAALFFVISLYRKGNEEDPVLSGLLKSYILLASAGFTLTAATFISERALAFYESFPVRFGLFAYEFTAILIALCVLVYKYSLIKFKQEKSKIRYVVIAFILLFAGGMMDFTEGLKFHNLKHTGNVANMIYAAMIFYAIFRLRLLDAGVLFKNFLVYTFVSVIVAGVYTGAYFLLGGRTLALVAAYLLISLAVVYYIKYLHRYISLFIQQIGGLPAMTGAKEAYNFVKSMEAGEPEKIRNILMIIKNYFEMDAALYLKEGSYYICRWHSEGAIFGRTVETATVILGPVIRYETKIPEEIAVLDAFGASILVPVMYSSEFTGALAGKKQTTDISFNQDEIELLVDMCVSLAFYIKAEELKHRLIEEENMKRIGMMAHQMAHEIKNPMTALWGAAQLLEGRSDMDRENISIIKDEVKRLTGILDSWKDFSSEIRLNVQELDITSLIADVIRVVNLQGNRAEIAYSKPKEPARLKLDADKIKQVLINVIMNSAQAMGDMVNPTIGIEVVKKGKFTETRVLDNGNGIPKEVMAKIKQPLFTTKPGGSGLGLAISERIVRAHGGSLIIESDGKTYTEVKISLPG
jgi:signal transduction histidine kinase